MLANWLVDFASIAGFFVSFAGFVITIFLLLESKNAVAAAQQAAVDTRNDLRRVLAATDLATALTVAQEITRWQREGSWHIAVDRYTTLRGLLVKFRAENNLLRPADKKAIQGILVQIVTLQETLEQATSRGQDLDASRMNSILTRQIDRIEELLAATKL